MSDLQLPDYGRYAIAIFLTAGTPLAVTYLTVGPPQVQPLPWEVRH
jgi:hypothetical protein